METKLLVKVIVVSVASVVLTISVIVGVGYAANIFTVDKDGTVRMVITDSGNVGIGTAIPQAKLDVQGTIKLGVSGTVFSTIKSQEFIWDPPSTASGTASTTTLVLSENGVILGILLPAPSGAGQTYCAYNTSLTGGEGINVWRNNGTNNSIDAAFENASGGAIDPSAATFVVYYLVP